MNRPEYKHATFGIEIYSLDSEKALFTLNSDQLFTPGSTTKLLTEGTALEVLGAGYRFHTAVYRTGSINSHHVLTGDLILVASGDPNLSNRIQPDGSLAFENEDHSYGGMPTAKAVPGDPLKVMREFADQIAATGIKKIRGQVLVDPSLFPEGDRELGTGVVISPVSVNDNVLDVTVTPGAAAGGTATIKVSPETSYAKMVNKIVTSKAGSGFHMGDPAEVANPDGTYTVTLTGSAPAGGSATLFAYPVAKPSRFAQTVLVDCLREKGIVVSSKGGGNTDFSADARFYNSEHLVAEHNSPSAFFTTDFMVHYLSYMAKQKDAALFQKALPILGRDGTLAEIQPESQAAGHVFAKTGTYASGDMLNKRLMLNGKGLAGYMTTADGRHLAFALYVNHVGLPLDKPAAAQETAGQALGEIAAAAYLLPIDRGTL